MSILPETNQKAVYKAGWPRVFEEVSFNQILDYINYLKPKRTLFTHMTALLDQEELLSKCPENVEPAYDGLEVTL